jgi:hypothetical protein
MGIFKLSLKVAFLSVMLQHCAQSRRGNIPEKEKEIWQAQELCANNSNGQALRCIAVEPNITENKAIVEVRLLDFNPGQFPYRILARPAGKSLFDVLTQSISVPEGSYFEVKPVGKTYIEEYEEWVMETTQNRSPNGLNIQGVGPGNGVLLIQGFIDYPELN